MEANLSEEMACFGRGLPGAERYETPELLWFRTDRPDLSGVLRTCFASEEKTYVEAKIRATLDYFQASKIGMGWSVGPTTRPADLGTYLQKFGFTYKGDSTGMAIALQALGETPALPTGLTITEIEDSESLKVIRNIEEKGFGATKESAQNYYEMYANVGFGKDMPWHHYLGWLNNTPVAMASLFFHAGVAGIFGVATLPQARRQGIGKAMTLHALQQARLHGYAVAVLTPTEMSIHIYHDLGFQEYCKLGHYTLSPKA